MKVFYDWCQYLFSGYLSRPFSLFCEPTNTARSAATLTPQKASFMEPFLVYFWHLSLVKLSQPVPEGKKLQYGGHRVPGDMVKMYAWGRALEVVDPREQPAVLISVQVQLQMHRRAVTLKRSSSVSGGRRQQQSSSKDSSNGCAISTTVKGAAAASRTKDPRQMQRLWH